MILPHESTLSGATPTAWGLWVFVVFIFTTAAAADKADEINSATADDDFNRAMETFSEGNFARAKRLYSRAYQKSQVSYILPNVALCSEKLGKYKTAISEYRNYLDSETNPEKNRELVDRVKRKIQELQQKLVRVVVKTAPNTPPDAALYINDAAVNEDWRKKPLIIDPGRVEFRMSCAGYLPRFILWNLPEGSSIELPFDDLMPVPKTKVIVACDRRFLPIRVYLNEDLVGNCPLVEELENGRYGLKLKGRRIRTFRDTFEVKGTASLTLQPTLERKRLWIPGTIALSLGAISLGVSGYLTYKWDDYIQKADTASANSVSADEKGDIDEREREKDEYDDYQRKEIQSRRGMIVTGVIGGTLIAAGTGLILYHILKTKKGEKNDAISADGAGISVRF